MCLSVSFFLPPTRRFRDTIVGCRRRKIKGRRRRASGRKRTRKMLREFALLYTKLTNALLLKLSHKPKGKKSVDINKQAT